MSGKVGLVTGGTRGIGRAISEMLASNICGTVISLYKSDEEAAIKWMKSLPRVISEKITIFKLDVSSNEATEAIEKLILMHGRIDVLINNAGITRNGPFLSCSKEMWDVVIDVNLSALHRITRPILKSMINNNYGRIINISSVNGQRGQANEVNYSTTKAGVIGFTKALAKEVAANNVTVNCVSPGYIQTELTDTLGQEEIENILSNVPIKRLGTPFEVARSIEFLAHEDAGFITGADISINGGLYM